MLTVGTAVKVGNGKAVYAVVRPANKSGAVYIGLVKDSYSARPSHKFVMESELAEVATPRPVCLCVGITAHYRAATCK